MYIYIYIYTIYIYIERERQRQRQRQRERYICLFSYCIFFLDNFKFKYTNVAFEFLDFDNGRL